jgi:hypothetical protein
LIEEFSHGFGVSKTITLQTLMDTIVLKIIILEPQDATSLSV